VGAFDRFRDSEIMGVRQYIEPGKHRLLVKRASMGPSKNPEKKKLNQENTIIEFKIVRSDTMKVGSVCNLVEVSTAQGYEGNVLLVTAGILGYEVEKMRKDPAFDSIFEAAFGEEQIFCGMCVDVVAQQVKTTKGGDYTAKTWEPVLASEYEEDGLIAPDGAYTGPEDDGEEAAA